MGSYKHYRNLGQGGDDVFVTTTCLDFALLFQRHEMRTRMARCLLGQFKRNGTVLHAYVVMPHHVHFVVRLPARMTVSELVLRVKKTSADALLPLLLPSELDQLAQQAGLDGRRFWKRSFRSLVLERDKTLMQKIGYVNANPLAAGLVTRAEDYRWSSARSFVECRWSFEEGCLAACLDHLKGSP